MKTSSRYATGGLVLVGLTALVLVLTATTLNAPTRDLAYLAGFLLASGGFSIFLAIAGPSWPPVRRLNTLRTRDGMERRSAAKTMAKAGVELLPVMRQGLTDPDWSVKWGSALAIRKLAKRSDTTASWGPTITEDLARMLSAGDRDLRTMAAQALEGIGPPARAALPALEAAKTNPNESPTALLFYAAAIGVIKGR